MKTIGSLLAITLLAASCTILNQRLNRKLEAAPLVQSKSNLRNEAGKFIENSKDLDGEQREKLLALREWTRSSINQIQQDSLKLRSLLIEEVLSPSYEDNEIVLIKSRMKKLEQKRLNVIFDAVDKANKIIGRSEVKFRDEMFFDLFDRPSVDGRL